MASSVLIYDPSKFRSYTAFYIGRRIEVKATSSDEAQAIAAEIFNAKYIYDVMVVLNDLNSLPLEI